MTKLKTKYGFVRTVEESNKHIINKLKYLTKENFDNDCGLCHNALKLIKERDENNSIVISFIEGYYHISIRNNRRIGVTKNMHQL